MSDNPCKDAVETWLLNPLPDIGMQALGLRLLAEAFNYNPQLKREDQYIQLPQDDKSIGPGWDWDSIDLDVYSMRTTTMSIPMTIFTAEHEFRSAGKDVARALTAAITGFGVVKGSVRLHIMPNVTTAGACLTTTLMWIGYKNG